MASKKNAVSVNGTRSKQFRYTECNPTFMTGDMIQKNIKHFKKNVFLSAFFLSNMFIAEHALALSVQPLQVKSALGEPFRAQVVITDIAGVDPATIKASLASDSQFIQMGINKKRQASDLNFNTVMTSPERGVITITSNRPLNDPYIEFVVQIRFGNNVRLQQVTGLVDPPLTRIQPETLNLPVQQIQLAEATTTPAPVVVAPPSNPYLTKVTSSVTSRTIPLIPSRNAPPPMSEPVTSVAQTPLAKEPVAIQKETPLIPSVNTPPPMSMPIPMSLPAPIPAPIPAPMPAPMPAPPIDNPPSEQNPAPQAPTIEQASAAAPIPDQTAPEPMADAVEKNTYKVKKNDSLWAIASRIQKETNQPVTVIMHSIQQLNKSAFIHGNPNHIKSGTTIILPNQQDTQEVPKTDTQAAVVENDDVESNKTPILRTPIQQEKTATTPYIRRGHLPDTKMTLVAPTLGGTAQGGANDKQSEDKARKLKQLNVQVSSARERNMTLGQQISELEAKIKVNDQKLALRNARLAELMQRLKNRKDVVQQNANRTPKS